MDYRLVLLLLVSAVAMAAASPAYSQYAYEETYEDDEKELANMMEEEEDTDGKLLDYLSEVQHAADTDCSRRSHKAYFDIGTKTYVFRYRACLDHAHKRLCYDARENLPPFCPWFFRGEDCVTIEWKVHGYTKYFDICDMFGRPCQQPIFGLRRSLPNGQCPPYYGPHLKATAQVISGADCFCMIKKGVKKCEGKDCGSLLE